MLHEKLCYALSLVRIRFCYRYPRAFSVNSLPRAKRLNPSCPNFTCPDTRPFLRKVYWRKIEVKSIKKVWLRQANGFSNR